LAGCLLVEILLHTSSFPLLADPHYLDVIEHDAYSFQCYCDVSIVNNSF